MTHLRDTHAHLSSPSVWACVRTGAKEYRIISAPHARTAAPTRRRPRETLARPRGLARARWSRGGAAASARESQSAKSKSHRSANINMFLADLYDDLCESPETQGLCARLSHIMTLNRSGIAA